ncbi:ADP-ribose pyrophosphatase [Parasporobacterium paucivorans DSM 15970]|uniref:ADP-ribose pyrophosphatase n=2 Tax=Parasporobacterium TaxID=115543 RepID=A0A1M6F883_9FIRM|nr:ADP-ribose pyrophosphatase [Parasporobacterium paucivorans DSM 15970]
MINFKRLKRELVHRGSIIDFYTDTIQLPDGRTAKWDHVTHNGAAAVVPVNDDNNILLVRQYRNSLDRATLEIPAGGINPGDTSTMICAARELEEETGFTAGSMEFLIRLKTAVAFTNENIDVYVARNLTRTHQNLDPDEFIEIEEFRLKDIIQMIYEGQIEDAKTISSIFAYAYNA